MVGSMLAAMQANKGAISIIQQQADTDDNADSDDDFYDDGGFLPQKYFHRQCTDGSMEKD